MSCMNLHRDRNVLSFVSQRARFALKIRFSRNWLGMYVSTLYYGQFCNFHPKIPAWILTLISWAQTILWLLESKNLPFGNMSQSGRFIFLLTLGSKFKANLILKKDFFLYGWEILKNFWDWLCFWSDTTLLKSTKRWADLIGSRFRRADF